MQQEATLNATPRSQLNSTRWGLPTLTCTQIFVYLIWQCIRYDDRLSDTTTTYVHTHTHTYRGTATHLSASCSCTWGTDRCGTCRNNSVRVRRCRSVSVACPYRRRCGTRGTPSRWHRVPRAVESIEDLKNWEKIKDFIMNDHLVFKVCNEYYYKKK